MPVSKDTLKWIKTPALPSKELMGTAVQLDATGRPKEVLYSGVSLHTYTAIRLFSIFYDKKHPDDSLRKVCKETVKAAAELLEAVRDYKSDE